MSKEESKKLEVDKKPEEKSGSLDLPKKSAKGGSAMGGKKKKARRQVSKAKANIQCTYNNTLITITDPSGATLGWSSSGLQGFKGAKKATAYAATQVVADVVEKIKRFGITELDVYVKGVGSGREAAIRALANKGFNLVSIKDITPIPHNGCRPRKPRRV